jgi:hypothetical protein
LQRNRFQRKFYFSLDFELFKTFFSSNFSEKEGGSKKAQIIFFPEWRAIKKFAFKAENQDRKTFLPFDCNWIMLMFLFFLRLNMLKLQNSCDCLSNCKILNVVFFLYCLKTIINCNLSLYIQLFKFFYWILKTLLRYVCNPHLYLFIGR